MTDSSDFTVKFWGVRGTMPVTDPAFSKVGGNTSCVEVMCGKKRIILDAGTGLVGLGEQIAQEITPPACGGGKGETHAEARDVNMPPLTSPPQAGGIGYGGEPIDILLSHTHIDHILGLLYFKPLYDKDAYIRVFAGHLLPETTLQHTLGKLMSPPIFPININAVGSTFEAVNFHAGDTITNEVDLGDGVVVRTTELHHPDRATGYRIEYDGKSICYITDIEHHPDELDDTLLAFIDGTDYLIYDSTYDDEEFQQFRGWGHSTWQHAIRLAESAHVKRLGLFHHHHQVNDIKLEEREKLLNKMDLLIDVSRENNIINI